MAAPALGAGRLFTASEDPGAARSLALRVLAAREARPPRCGVRPWAAFLTMAMTLAPRIAAAQTAGNPRSFGPGAERLSPHPGVVTSTPSAGARRSPPSLSPPPEIEDSDPFAPPSLPPVSNSSVGSAARSAPVVDGAAAIIPPELLHVKWAALIDGGWSIAMTVAWAIAARAWDAPQPQGLFGLATARVLYGTTWSILVATELAIFRAVMGEAFDHLSHGRMQNEWMVGFHTPGGCPPGSAAGCGFGLGGYSELSVRVGHGALPIEVLMSGGWIMGHHSTDARRTLAQSTWAQAPLIGRVHFPLELGPIQLEAALGAGIYFGLHAAHVHPRAAHPEVSVGLTEFVVLSGGLGPGVHGRVFVHLYDTLTLDAGVDVAPLLLGGKSADPSPEVAALRILEPDGIVWWRRASAGLSLSRRILHPVRLGLRLVGAQLSPGRVEALGHRMAVLQFEVPFELGGDAPESQK